MHLEHRRQDTVRYHVVVKMSDTEERQIGEYAGLMGACARAREMAPTTPGRQYLVQRVVGGRVLAIDAQYEMRDGVLCRWMR